jgi:hypothetical protein
MYFHIDLIQNLYRASSIPNDYFELEFTSYIYFPVYVVNLTKICVRQYNNTTINFLLHLLETAL